MRDEYVAEPRRPAGERERREYDAFGPWMQRVRRAEELPPRFDAFWPELSAAEAVAKVPYRVERRKALPGSDLYERVLGLCPEGLVLLLIVPVLAVALIYWFPGIVTWLPSRM